MTIACVVIILICFTLISATFTLKEKSQKFPKRWFLSDVNHWGTNDIFGGILRWFNREKEQFKKSYDSSKYQK